MVLHPVSLSRGPPVLRLNQDIVIRAFRHLVRMPWKFRLRARGPAASQNRLGFDTRQQDKRPGLPAVPFRHVGALARKIQITAYVLRRGKTGAAL